MSLPDQRAQRRRCYVITPPGVDLSALQNVLDSEGADYSDAGDVLSKAPNFGAIPSAIRASDFVVAIIAGGPPNPNVFYEIGLAHATGRPILLFVDPGATLPFDLAAMFHARTRIDNLEAIQFNVSAFLELLNKQRLPAHPPDMTPRRSVGVRADEVQQYWQTFLGLPREARSGAKLTEILEKAFRAAGAEVSRPAYFKAGWADLIVTHEALDSWPGNPIIVEVKTGAIGLEGLQRAVLQAASHLGNTSARAALVVYDSPHPMSPENPIKSVFSVKPGSVFALSAAELLQALAEDRLVEQLRVRTMRAAEA